MANLLSQNIGTNYKSILNLDATTINTPLDATLRAVTDGMGTSSLLQLSTEAVGISRTVALSAGATNPRLFNEVYTINNSGAQTGTLTGLFLNATETALNGITHNLMDLQVGGVSKFKVGNQGSLTADGNIQINGGYLTFSSLSRIRSTVDSNIVLFNNAINNFNLLQLGGTTSSFPAIKRNGAQIDFRLADDSGYCNLYTGFILLAGTPRLYFIDGTNFFNHTGSALTYFNNSVLAFTFSHTGALFASSGTIDASARVQIDSTTKGFLPPRMTTTQKNAIATPATGLVVFDTTLAKLAVYTGAAWETVTSV